MVAALLVVACLTACEPTPEQLWAKAQAAAQNGEYSAASIHLKNLLRRHPDDATARAALGMAALEMGDALSADKEFVFAIDHTIGFVRTPGAAPEQQKADEQRRTIEIERFVKSAGSTAAGQFIVDTQFARIEALLSLGRFEDALNQVAAVSGAPNTELQALMASGRAREGLGQLPEAEADYRKASAAAPDETEPLVALATLAFRAKRGEEGDAVLERALLLDPRAVPALILKGRRVMDTRGPGDAEAVFGEALDATRTPQEKMQVLIYLAEAQFANNDLQGATATVGQLEAIAPADINTRFLRARVQAQSGDYSTAILGLQRIMNDAPGFVPAERLLGFVHYLNGNLEMAAMHFSHVIEMGDKDPYLGSLLAEVRLQQNRPEQALQTLLPIIRQGPGAAFDQALLALAGQASLSAGDSESALAYCTRGSQQYPDDERFRLCEVSARLASGDVETASMMLSQMRASSSNPLVVDYLSAITALAEGDNAKAEVLATRLAAENADAAWAHLLLAWVHGAAGRNEAARLQFETVLKLEPDNQQALLNLAHLDYQKGDSRGGENRLLRVIEAHPDDVQARLLLAEAQLSERRFNDALDRARQAARLAPDMPKALNLLGRAAAAADRWEEARDSFSRVTTLTPGDARAWINLARATVAAGNGGTLPDSLTKAMEIAPEDPVVLATAGDLYMEMRQPVDAAKYFQRAYAIAPNGDVAIRECRARIATTRGSACSLLSAWIARHPQDLATRLFQATVHQARGDVKLAIAEYELVLAKDPRQAAALNNLAWLYFLAGDARALGIAERALQAQPQSAPAMDTLGWIHVRQGDKRRGLDLIAAAAKSLPKNLEIQYHLAFALAENGQTDRARKILAEALQSNPGFPSRAEAEQLMRRLEGPDRGASS